MRLKATKVSCVMPVFKKPRRVSGALRHVVFSKSLSGTKSLIFRAGRYSVHQFIRSFSSLFAAIIVFPSLLGKGLLCLTPKNRGIGLPWTTSISASIKSTVMGIPSVFRSVWNSVKMWFYSIGATLYHAIESVKSTVMGFKIMQALSHVNQSIASFFVGMYQSISIPIWHFTDYVGTIVESFRTGTHETLERLRAKEQQWGHDVLMHLDNGKNYVTGAIHSVFTAISEFFGKIWSAISSSTETIQTSFSNASARVKERTHVVWEKINYSAGTVGNVFRNAPLSITNFFAQAPGVVKEKAQYIVVRIHDTSTKAVARVKIAMADLMSMIQGAGEKLHEDEVHLKTVAHDIHGKTHDLAEGVKVGTISIFRKVGQTGRVMKEQAELYFKTAYGKLNAGKLFVKRRVAMGLEQLGAGVLHLRDQISETGRSAHFFIATSAHKVHDAVGRVTRPIVAPFIYVYQLPQRVYQSFNAPSVSSYVFMSTAAILASMLYLKIECRYKREIYARQLAPHPKVKLHK